MSVMSMGYASSATSSTKAPFYQYQQPLMPPQDTSMVGINREIDRKWRDTVDSLLNLRGIGDNWDGEGASAPFPEIIDSIITLVRSQARRDLFSSPPTKVNILRDGEVSLDWFAGDERATVLFDEPFKAQVILSTRNQAAMSFRNDYSQYVASGR